MLTVDVDIREPLWQRHVSEAVGRIPTICRDVCMQAGLSVLEGELSIVLADEEFVQALNRQYRHRDKPTNVLSFPTTDTPLEAQAYVILGDVVLAYQVLAREAKAQSKSLEAHLVHLLVHGVLHLLGFDHEHASDATEMEALEITILAHLGYESPYETVKTCEK